MAFRGVFMSRIGLRASQPGNGEFIDWQVGERVQISAGQDKGRVFVITSERLHHQDAPGNGWVREGYFADDPSMTPWCKAEQCMWMTPETEDHQLDRERG